MESGSGLPETLHQAIQFFANPDNALAFVASLRWPNGVVCPRCNSTEHSFISTRRVWKCKACKKQFSVKVGTIFEDSPIGLDRWLCAVWMIVNCKNGVSSYEIARDLAVTQKSAWFMLHRIRLALQQGSFEKLSGEVEADESFIGGKTKNMHLRKLAKLKLDGRARRGVVGKAIVSGLLDRRTRKAFIKVLPNTRAYHLRRNIIENVEKGSTIYSDALKSYANVSVDGFMHEFIDHSETYVRGRVHTNGLENFWSLFKRALKGTYVSVEPFHLQAYADEQAYRYNNHKRTDIERFIGAVAGIAGKRLTYAELTGKNLDTSLSLA